MDRNKRKSPPRTQAAQHAKRQRLDTGAASPLSPDADSLSTLSSDAVSHASSPEVELSLAMQLQGSRGITDSPAVDLDDDGDADGDAVSGEEEEDDDDDDEEDEPLAFTTANGGTVSGKSRPAVAAATAQNAGDDDDEDDVDADADADADGDEDGDGDLSQTQTQTQSQGRGDVSTNAVAGAQSAKTGPISNGGGPLRPTVGGKGKKGEEALEHAVAAREEVERRRVELKGAGAKQGPPGLHKTPKVVQSGLEDDGVKVKLEDDDTLAEATEEEEAAVPAKREKPAVAEEKANVIRFVVVTNDEKPESLIILAGLKNIFQKQLPKMPREYIARLVFDRNHYSMAIVKRGLEVVGGVTFRPFEARRFAEIVFFAITGTEQVKGYGSYLMNHLKDHVKEHTSCMHFLTYADNYAIGYFKKQGFTKEVGLDRSVWAGYIKDYEGGTIMHCAMLERIKYMEVVSILERQKEVVLAQIRQKSQTHVVHPGLSLFLTLPPGQSLDPSMVPGLKESGWTAEMDALTRRPVRGPQFAVMQRLHALLADHPSAWAFAQPVNGSEVTDYYNVIKKPMDLATMETKLEGNHYSTLTEFLADAKLIFDNCRAYNDSGSNYVKNANKLEAFLNEQVKQYDVD